LLTLCALLKLGVLNPAGASVADCAATLASPVPNAANPAKRQKQRRTFLQWAMIMSIPPKSQPSTRVRDVSWLTVDLRSSKL
jgi:hypothetical protein